MTIYYRFKYHGCKIFIINGEIYKKISKKTRVTKFDALASKSYTSLISYAMKYKLDNCILVNRINCEGNNIVVEPLPKNDKPKYTSKIGGVNIWNVTGNIENIVSAVKSSDIHKDVSKVVSYDKINGKVMHDANHMKSSKFELFIDGCLLSDYNPYVEYTDIDDHIDLAKELITKRVDVELNIPKWYSYNNPNIVDAFVKTYKDIDLDTISNYLLSSLIITNHNESKLRFERKRAK